MAKPKTPKKRARVTLDLGVDLTTRLSRHATERERSESDVVRELVKKHIPRYRLQIIADEDGETEKVA